MDRPTFAIARDAWLKYVDTDIFYTDYIVKENEKNMDERRLMNGMKKDMAVVVVNHPNKQGWRGMIVAFDYNHLLVGVRFAPKGELHWFAPSNLRIEYQIGYQHVIADEIDAKRRLNAQHGIAYVPKKVIYDEAAGVTVVLWMDGTKTIVRAAEGEAHDAYLGYCIALTKKMHGTNSALKRDLENVLVVKKDEKSNTPLPTMKEYTDALIEDMVMEKLNDAMMKGE